MTKSLFRKLASVDRVSKYSTCACRPAILQERHIQGRPDPELPVLPGDGGIDDRIRLSIVGPGIANHRSERPRPPGFCEGRRGEAVGQREIDRQVVVGVGLISRRRAGDRQASLPGNVGRADQRPKPVEVADPLVAGLSGGIWIVARIIELAAAILHARIEGNVRRENDAPGHASAHRAEIAGVAEAHDVAEHVRMYRSAAGAKAEPRSGRGFDQAEIEPRHRELLGVVGGGIGLPAIRILVAEIVEMVRGHQTEGVPVGLALEFAGEQRILAERLHNRVVGAGVGVCLIAQTRLREDAQLARRDAVVDLREKIRDFVAHVLRRVLAGDRGGKIAARHFVGTQPEIQHAEFELHPRQARVEEQHALQGADCGFVIAEFRFDLRIAEGGVEIVRPQQRPLEQDIGFNLEVRIGRGRALRERWASGDAGNSNQANRSNSEPAPERRASQTAGQASLMIVFQRHEAVAPLQEGI